MERVHGVDAHLGVVGRSEQRDLRSGHEVGHLNRTHTQALRAGTNDHPSSVVARTDQTIGSMLLKVGIDEFTVRLSLCQYRLELGLNLAKDLHDGTENRRRLDVWEVLEECGRDLQTGNLRDRLRGVRQLGRQLGREKRAIHSQLPR